MRGLFAALVALLGLVVARPAWAQVDLRAQADAEVVGLGDVVHVTMQATSSGSSPIDPQIGATAGFVVVGIAPSTSTQMTIVNGVMSTSRVLTTTWTLRATKVGTSVLGPPTVSVDGTRYKAPALHVKVVPQGQAPPRAPPRGRSDPFDFDPFNGLLQQFGQFPGFEPPRQVEPQPPPNDPRLALDAPRGAVAFLHAVIDKTEAVVGEQVTYSVYLYIDPQAVTREPEETDAHEAPANDFVRRALLKDGDRVQEKTATVGDRIWLAKLIRQEALFPLKTGDLPLGPTTERLVVPGGGIRATEDLRVRVTEPPVAGRPAGYAVGDVGDFQIAAEVVGKAVEQEGAVGVDVTVSGEGNVPASVTPPEQRGVEWLEPQVVEKVGPQPGARWGGSRTFRYVVRMHRAGDVDLGDFTLPFWNPKTRAYETARSPLGVVHVTPSTTAAKAPEPPPDPLPGLPALRTALGGSAPRARRHLADAPVFWGGLGAMPLAYAVAIATSTSVRRARERRAARGKSPREEMQARVLAAEDASANGDPQAIDAATARAIEAACVARAVNVRAVATSDVARTLDAAGVPGEIAREVEELLKGCEAARFSSASGADATEARGRWTRARAVIARLGGAA